VRFVRTSVAVVVGVVVWALLAFSLSSILQAVWADYAAAVPSKDYTLPMLISRLSLAAIATAVAGAAAMLVARDRGLAAWLCGGALLAISLRPHLVTVWDDYPVWYHFVYLGYLVPVAGLAGRRVRPAGGPAARETGPWEGSPVREQPGDAADAEFEAVEEAAWQDAAEPRRRQSR